MIEKVGELHFTKFAFRDDIVKYLTDQGYFLEPIYADRLIVGYRVYQAIEDYVVE